MGKLGLGDILVNFFDDIENASKKARKEIEKLVAGLSETLSEMEGLSQKKVTNVIELLQSSDSFDKMVKRINEVKDASSSVVIAAATFPNGKFLTSRALEERMIDLGFNSIPRMFLHQIISRFKKSCEKEKKVVALMENLDINWNDKEMVDELIDINVLPSYKERVQHALRLNYEGRELACSIAKSTGCTTLIIRILGSGMDDATLAQSIDNLELSSRAYNILKLAKIGTIGELISKKEKDLRKLKNSGKIVISSINKALAKYSLCLIK
jgi:hypothetical protein